MVKYVDHIEIDSKISQCKPNVINIGATLGLFFFFHNSLQLPTEKTGGAAAPSAPPVPAPLPTEVPLSKATNPQLLSSAAT